MASGGDWRSASAWPWCGGPAEAQQIEDWSGYFPNGGEVYYFDHPMDVGPGGSVTQVTTADSTFLSQFSATHVLDQYGEIIGYTMLRASPNTWTLRWPQGPMSSGLAGD